MDLPGSQSRPAVPGSLTIKTRVGYESESEFSDLLDLYADLPIDGIAIHGRTVREKYQSEVHTAEIARAVERLSCPVHANGSIVNVATALSMIQHTNADGLMIGRGAIRNPWLFRQVHEALSDQPVYRPTLADQFRYIEDLYEELAETAWKFEEVKHVQRMKKFMNYIASGIGEGNFSREIRRVNQGREFGEVCNRYLSGSGDLPDDPNEDGKLFCGFRALTIPEPVPREVDRVNIP